MNDLYNLKPNTDPKKGLFSDVEKEFPFEFNPMKGLEEPTFDFSLIEVKDGKVNARGLWQFLGISQEFANWIKYQIQSLNLVESEDFDKIVKPIGIKKNGQTDYLLTIDTAKDLAMVTRNDQGQKARNYFKECEKKLREISEPKELSTLEILELATGEIKRLKKDLEYKNQIVIERSESVPAQTMRLTINRLVRNYAKKEMLIHQFVWKKLYEEFKYRFHIDLPARAKKGKSKIQVAEDLGQLENLYNLALKMFEVDKLKNKIN